MISALIGMVPIGPPKQTHQTKPWSASPTEVHTTELPFGNNLHRCGESCVNQASNRLVDTGVKSGAYQAELSRQARPPPRTPAIHLCTHHENKSAKPSASDTDQQQHSKLCYFCYVCTPPFAALLLPHAALSRTKHPRLAAAQPRRTH